MAVDFDRLVNKPCEKVFGGTIHYTAGDQTFDISGIYDSAWSQVTLGSGRGGFAPVSSISPRLALRLSAFPDGIVPVKGHSFIRANGDSFVVVDVQPDGFGFIGLTLKRTT